MIKCEICGKSIGDERALEKHANAKHPQPVKQPLLSQKQIKRIKNWSIVITILVVIVGGLAYLNSTAKNLPPTTDIGHEEASPASHILKEPMHITVQKHMLEHADGSGPPGIIINYNCADYTCNPDLIEKLEQFAVDYPINVYVAPFPNMDAKIALTKLGKIEVLNGYNYGVIQSFITSR